MFQQSLPNSIDFEELSGFLTSKFFLLDFGRNSILADSLLMQLDDSCLHFLSERHLEGIRSPLSVTPGRVHGYQAEDVSRHFFIFADFFLRVGDDDFHAELIAKSFQNDNAIPREPIAMLNHDSLDVARNHEVQKTEITGACLS